MLIYFLLEASSGDSRPFCVFSIFIINNKCNIPDFGLYCLYSSNAAGFVFDLPRVVHSQGSSMGVATFLESPSNIGSYIWLQ